MMLNLNLLPPLVKKELRIEKINRQLLTAGTLILVTLIIFALLLGLINLFLWLQTKSLQKQIIQTEAHLEMEQVEEFEESIKALNQALINLDERQTAQINYSTILNQLIQLIPTALQVRGLSLDNSGQMQLTGYAPTREQLLQLKENLENSPDFIQIEFPLSNLLKSREIDFSLTFQSKDLFNHGTKK